jgi:hypothetical protein
MSNMLDLPLIYENADDQAAIFDKCARRAPSLPVPARTALEVHEQVLSVPVEALGARRQRERCERHSVVKVEARG